MSERRCFGCMRLTSQQFCEHCGWPADRQNDPHQLPVGTVLQGKYQIGRVLGQGGFGITYLGWDMNLDIRVCIKEFYPSATVNRDTTRSTVVNCNTTNMEGYYATCLERFLREGKALAKFRNVPQIVGIHDFFQLNNTAYMVMEFVSGVDLAKYIQKRGGRLPMDEVLKILKPVMEALQLVHEAGIIHRDISPDNIMLEPREGAKLLDFGAVRNVEHPDAEKELTRATEAILKNGFAPMEQYVAKGSLGPWTDVYAMSATIYYCLTGRIPEDSPIRLMEGTELDWTGAQGLTERQKAVLEKGMEPRAKDRIASIRELMDALYAPEAAVPVAEPVPEKKPEKDPLKTEIVSEFKVQLPAEPPKPAPEPEKAPEPTPAVTEPVPEKQPEEPVTLPDGQEDETQKPEKKGKPMRLVSVAVLLLATVLLMMFLTPKKADSNPGPTAQTSTRPTTAPTQPTTAPTQPTVDPEEAAYANAEALLAEGKIAEAAIEFGKLIGYRDARERSFELWNQIAVRQTIDASYTQTIALKNDGTVYITSGSGTEFVNAVATWTDIISVSAGECHVAGLKADGTVVSVFGGLYDYGQAEVSEWTDIVAVDATITRTFGLKADGTIVCTDRNTTMDFSSWSDIVAIDTGYNNLIALKSDGTVVCTTHNTTSWTNIVAVAAGWDHVVGLKADGSVVVAADALSAKWCDVSGWRDIVAISAGDRQTAGLRSDGTVVVAGENNAGQGNTGAWTDVVAISNEWLHTVGLRADGTLYVTGSNDYLQCDVKNWKDIMLPRNKLPWWGCLNEIEQYRSTHTTYTLQQLLDQTAVLSVPANERETIWIDGVKVEKYNGEWFTSITAIYYDDNGNVVYGDDFVFTTNRYQNTSGATYSLWVSSAVWNQIKSVTSDDGKEYHWMYFDYTELLGYAYHQFYITNYIDGYATEYFISKEFYSR